MEAVEGVVGRPRQLVDEPSPLEAVKSDLEAVMERGRCEPPDGRPLELEAHHGGRLEHVTVLAPEAVEPGREERMDRGAAPGGPRSRRPPASRPP